MSDRLADLKVPAALRPRAADVLEVTDRFCAQHLDLEYAELCRRLVGRLGRNFLFDPSQDPRTSARPSCAD
jgi:hypothetical protein